MEGNEGLTGKGVNEEAVLQSEGKEGRHRVKPCRCSMKGIREERVKRCRG